MLHTLLNLDFALPMEAQTTDTDTRAAVNYSPYQIPQLQTSVQQHTAHCQHACFVKTFGTFLQFGDTSE